MKTLVKTILHFFILFTSILLVISIILFVVPGTLNRSETATGNYTPISNSKIIIAGDSRANRQLDPKLLHDITSLNVINISQDGHDLYAVSKMLLDLHLEEKTIVLSASSWQLNDGSLEGDHFRIESFIDLAFVDKIKLYKNDVHKLYRKQAQLFLISLISRSNTVNDYDSTRRINFGYKKTTCLSQIKMDADFFKNHFAYINPNYNGIKKQLLVKALINLNSLRKCRILIYNGPVSNLFRNAAKANGIFNLELTYDSTMRSLTKNIANLKFISFLNNMSIPDDDFYDGQHLCESGVPIFTNMVAQELRKDW